VQYPNIIRFLRGLLAAALLLGGMAAAPARAQAKFVQTPYQNPKALVDIYLDDPQKLGSALYWLRALVNPLIEAPYSMFPEDMSLIVLMHGTEIVTLARKNEERYQEVVQRMRYYADMGVKFKVCGLALQDFQYTANDLHDFVEVTPSAITELMHWQNRGYALITPQVHDKKFSTEQIR
jgi:intracellular sulfur oxidation DsrE/DsrF family protein